MDTLAALILRLQRLGYRTQTFGTKIVVELDAHSKFRGSASEIERILPLLEKGFKPSSGVINKPKTDKKKKRRARKKSKIKVKSARVPTVSLETQAWARTAGWRKSRSPGGLLGLGKHR